MQQAYYSKGSEWGGTMVAVRDNVRISQRGGEVIHPPDNPKDNWDSAVRAVWQAAKTKARDNGPETLDGIPGAYYQGSMSEIIPSLWPTLTNEDSKQAKIVLTGRIRHTGSGLCVDKGAPRGKGKRAPIWFVPDKFAALPNRAEREKSMTRSRPLAELDAEVARDLAMQPKKADVFRYALNYARDHGLSTSTTDVLQFMTDYGYKIHRTHANRIRVAWVEAGENRRHRVPDEPIAEPEPEEPEAPAEEKKSEMELHAVNNTAVVPEAIPERWKGEIPERTGGKLQPPRQAVTEVARTDEHEHLDVEDVLHEPAQTTEVVPTDEHEIEEEFVRDRMPGRSQLWDASMQQRIADADAENRMLREKVAMLEQKLVLAKGMIGLALD